MARRGASRHLTAWVVAGLTLPLALAACSGSSSSSGSGDGTAGGAVTLRVLDYYNNEPDNGVYQSTLEACGAAEGITIERETVPGASLIAKVLQQASSKTLPDVLMLDNPDLQQIAATGALTPLSDYGLSGDGYVQGVVDASTYEGELYGLQPITNSIALFYNKDILDAAGVAAPTTWAELKTAAAALTKGDQYGIAFSAPANYEGTWQFLPFMWSNGGDEKDIATQGTADALQLWVDLVSSGSASKSVVNWTQADVNDQFMAGKAAMMINGPWQFPVLNAKTDLHYVVAPTPSPEAGKAVVSPLGGETWTVPNTGDKTKEAAAAKIVTCLNSDENQLALATKRQTVPTKTALLATFAQQQPTMTAFTEIVKTARARTGELGADWPAAATKIYTAVQSSLAGGVAPMTALEQAQNG